MNKKLLYRPRRSNPLKSCAYFFLGALSFYLVERGVSSLISEPTLSEKKYELTRDRLFYLADQVGDKNGVLNLKEYHKIMKVCEKNNMFIDSDAYSLEEMEKGIGKLVLELERK